MVYVKILLLSLTTQSRSEYSQKFNLTSLFLALKIEHKTHLVSEFHQNIAYYRLWCILVKVDANGKYFLK